MNFSKLAPWNWFKKEDEMKGFHPIKLERNEIPLSHPIDRIHQEMERMFESMFRNFGFAGSGTSLFPKSFREDTWLKPSLDISSTDTEYIINIELPGVNQDDVHVEISGDTMRIRGEKKQEEKREDQEYYSIERFYGSFQRVLSLPEDADRDGISASLKNGVMSIRIPRKEAEASQSKKIEVKSD